MLAFCFLDLAFAVSSCWISSLHELGAAHLSKSQAIPREVQHLAQGTANSTAMDVESCPNRAACSVLCVDNPPISCLLNLVNIGRNISIEMTMTRIACKIAKQRFFTKTESYFFFGGIESVPFFFEPDPNFKIKYKFICSVILGSEIKIFKCLNKNNISS